MIHIKAVLHILGTLLLFLGAALILPAIVAFIYDESDAISFLITIAISVIMGLAVFFGAKSDQELRIKDGFLVVTFSWVLFAFIGALPFYISGYIPSYTDAFFETMSGFTTTGASILTNIEALPHGLLFWRSFTHWLGGMGIILLSLAILPLLGVGGMQLFKAEVPGPSPDKLTPRIKHTAELLWGVYLLFTIIEIGLLRLAGMSLFDSACHTFGTMATGGFSTKNTSIAFYNSAFIDYIIIVFMIIAGLNFALHYLALRGKPIVYWKNAEAMFFLATIGMATTVIGADVYLNGDDSFFVAVRHTLFQVVSIITTTGYGTVDYEQWSTGSQILIYLLMFIGGSAGSTGGGMKMVRVIILVKFGYNELKRLVHPQAILPVRVGNTVIHKDVLTNITGFLLLYMVIFVIGFVVMSFLGLDFTTALGSVAATINNIGPGLGAVGPTENYAQIPILGKWFLSFLMLVGRLEIFTVIVIFTVSFWKK